MSWIDGAQDFEMEDNGVDDEEEEVEFDILESFPFFFVSRQKLKHQRKANMSYRRLQRDVAR